jgi:hypothetical protein
MRSELETLEQIDQYLAGKMSAEQAASFKAEIAADPVLQRVVNGQELLIQTVNRQALMVEINSVAGLGAAGSAAGGAAWGLTQWIVTALVVGVVGVGGYFIYDNYSSSELPITEEGLILDNQVDVLETDTGDFISFSMESDLNANIVVAEVVDQNTIEDDVVDHGNINSHNNDDDVNAALPFVNPNSGNVLTNVDKDDKDLSQTPVHATAKNRKATFPGGLLEMKKFFKKEMRYPRTPADKGLSGTVKVFFLVSADGQISELSSDCFILKDREGLKLSQFKFSGNGKSRRIFEEKAEQIFRKSSPWTPATNAEGNPTLSWQKWYVNFDLKGESSIYQLEEDVIIDGPESTIQITD